VNSNHVGDGAFYGQDEFLGSFDFSQGLLLVLSLSKQSKGATSFPSLC
jgi:hypothetical protein